jgi:hypothetical protein
MEDLIPEGCSAAAIEGEGWDTQAEFDGFVHHSLLNKMQMC